MTASLTLPTGTVAFLLTDIEGSTPLWESDADAMHAAVDRHDQILDAAVSAHGGVRPPAQGEGDSIVAAFSRASDAVLAALDAQRAFATEPWPTSKPLRVRMAVHSGEARFVDDGNYAGQAIIRTARLRAIAHGGQVLVSAAARDLTVDQLADQVSFVDLGEHRLRDLARPERVYQLTDTSIPVEFPPLRSLNARPHNLPVQLSSFIGRTDDIATVVSLARANRLVTITGAGGAGKTRLALQAAAELVDDWPDGTWLVELAEVTDPDAVAAAIAAALQVQGEIGEAAADQLANVVADRDVLVVLDNCEHLIDRVAKVVDRLLRRCPGLTVVATSREPLEIGGEVAWRIPPLAVPDPASIDTLGQYDSVLLFLDRAQNVRPNFHLTDDTGPIVGEICQRLGGIPLAIELAAARVRSLTPAQILDGLADAFRLLSSSGRATMPRQHTLDASITWSHDLLSTDEQVLLRRLAVFNGGCSLEDAEAVVADDTLPTPMVLDLMDRLVAQSLVSLDDRSGTARYRMLETVRQYAARRLDQAGETEVVRTRHAEHYQQLVLELGPRLEGGDEQIPLARLLADHDNLRTTLDTLTRAGQWRDVAEVCAALAHLWEIFIPAEGLEWLAAALDHVEPADGGLRARLLVARAYIHLGGGNMIEMAIDAKRALAETAAAGNEATAGRAAALLAVAYTSTGSDDVGLNEVAEQFRCDRDLYGELFARVMPSVIALFMGDTERGWRLHGQAQPLVTAARHHLLTAVHRCGAAVGHCSQGDFEAAEREIAAAEASLAIIADAAGVDPELLLRRTVPGALALMATSWCRLVRVDAPELERLDRVIASVRAEGCFFAEVFLSFPAAGYALRTLGPDAALERAALMAERAEQLGVGLMRMCALSLRASALYGQDHFEAAKGVLDDIEHTGSAAMPQYIHARSRHLRGAILLAEGALGEADAVAHDALGIAVRHTFRWEAAMSLELLASIASASQSWVEAARLLGAAARLRGDFDLRWVLPGHDRRLAADLTTLKSELGDDGFDVAFAAGYALTLDEAAEYAQRARGERKRPMLGWDSLTPTEWQVVEHVQAGCTNPQIAEKLFMSRETVKTHLSHVFTKLGVRTRSELAVAAATRKADPRGL